MRTQPVAPDAQCAVGGVLILGGADTNGDGVLAEPEVTTRSVVCHGVTGPTGMQGSPGLAGTNGQDSPLADLTCANGEGPRFSADSGAWGCAPDEDTLGALQCPMGAVAKWDGQSWTCGTDTVGTDTLADLRANCAAAQVATYDGAQWRCATRQDADTLAMVTCAQPGTVLLWTTTGWSCGRPPDQDTLGALACLTGQVPKWNGSAWQCDVDQVSPPGVDTLGSLNCMPGQLAKFDGVDWVCGPDANTLNVTCNDGQVPKWNGGTTSWSCGADVDTNTLGSLVCAEGQVAKYVGTFWTCANDDNALAVTCTDGQIPKWSGTGWTCATDEDTNTLGALACASGEIAKWNGAAWACAVDAVASAGMDTLASLSCAPGQLARFNGVSWVCASETNPLPATCVDGQVAKWNGTGWTCGVDVDTNTLATLACSNGQLVKWNGASWACAEDDNTLSITCTNGQVPKWNGTGWGCDVDEDTNTLATLACAAGQVAKWNGSAWACAADDNALSITCTNGQVPKWSGTGWTCGVDVDTNTLATLACAAGQLAKWNGTAWACAADDNTLSFACANGQVPKWSGTGWACGVDVDTNTLGALSCAAGQVAKFNGTAWACAADDNTLSFSCTNGQVPKWTGSGWACGVDVDTNTLAGLSCSSGQVAKWNGTAWACAADDNALSFSCANGQVPKWSGSGWACAADVDTNTLGTLSCAAGQVAKFNGTAWACAADDNALAITCSNGQVPKWSGTGWACGADEDTLAGLSCAAGEVPKLVGSVFSCEPDADTLAALACPDGQIPKRAGGAWTCAADATGAGSLFARTFIVAPGATAVDGGNTLRSTLAGITASTASPALVWVEPGTYDLGATAATIPAYVTVKGSGRDATFIQATSTALLSSGNTEIRDLRISGGFAAIRQNGAVGLLRVRRVTINTTATGSATPRGVDLTGAGLDLDDVDITINGNSNSCAGVLVNNTSALGVRATNLRINLTNCADPRGLSGAPAVLHVGELLLRGADITLTGSVGSTTSIRLTYFSRITLEDVSVRQDSTASLSVPEDEGIALFCTDIQLSDVRVDARSNRPGVGLSLNSAVAGGKVVARDVEVTTGGPSSSFRGANFYSHLVDVDGMRIRTQGNADYALVHSTAGAVGRFRGVHVEKSSTTVGVSAGPTTTTTFMHGSVRGPGTGILRSATGIVELFSSQVEGAIPAPDPNFRCASSYSAAFAQLAGCTF